MRILKYMPSCWTWWREVELNYRHMDFQSIALPLSYRAVVGVDFVYFRPSSRDSNNSVTPPLKIFWKSLLGLCHLR